MPAVFDQYYVKRLQGRTSKRGKNKRELAEQLREDMRNFKKNAGLARLVVVWLHRLKSSSRPDPRTSRWPPSRRRWNRTISRSRRRCCMAYARSWRRAVLRTGPPNLTVDLPVMERLAEGPPRADRRQGLQDGQTMMKSVLATGVQGAMLGLVGVVFHQHPRQSGRRSAGRPGSRSRRRRSRSWACSSTSSSPISIPSSTARSTTRCGSTITHPGRQ